MTVETEFVCRNCGGTNLRAWYVEYTSQGVDILRLDGDELQFDYDGTTSMADDAGDNFEYRCRDCDDCADTLEELVGLPRPKGIPRYTDEQAIMEINRILSMPEWQVGMFEDIEQIVRDTPTGSVEHSDPHWDRH